MMVITDACVYGDNQLALTAKENPKKVHFFNPTIFLLQKKKKGEQNLCQWSTRSDVGD